MFIAMNQFSVSPGREREFEEGWRTRESYLSGFEGFVHFSLLKSDEAGEYLSHTIWRSREDFLQWTQSEAFKNAHSVRTAEGVLAGHPRARFFDAVVAEKGNLAVLAG